MPVTALRSIVSSPAYPWIKIEVTALAAISPLPMSTVAPFSVRSPPHRRRGVARSGAHRGLRRGKPAAYGTD